MRQCDKNRRCPSKWVKREMTSSDPGHVGHDDGQGGVQRSGAQVQALLQIWIVTHFC